MALTVFTKTITNRLGVYAGEPTNKWGTLVWGTDKWGWKNTQWMFDKFLADSLATDSAITEKKVTHLISEAFSLGTIISKKFGIPVSDSFSLSSAITVVNIINNGWILSKGGEPNALNWPQDNFTIVTDPTTTWAIVASPSTTWVEL